MLIHSVFFWLKPELTELETLRAIPAVDSLFIGRPAAIPPRPVVDGSYSYAVSIQFKDLAAHDAYQIDPAHKAFVEKCKPLWDKVQIYDAAD